MGWEVHMTRAAHWPDSDRHPITAEEWLAAVATDPELRLDAANGPYFAVWSGPCSYPEGGWFDWAGGCVSTKRPDRAILGKMLQLAARLGARVQGDDGEEYTDASQLAEERSAATRSVLRWQRLVRVVGVAVLVLSAGWLSLQAVRWVWP